MLKFIKNDKKSYEVRVANGAGYDWELAGKLVKDAAGVWHFEYEDQSIEYEDSLEESEAELKEDFKNGETNGIAFYFGTYKYNK